MEQFLLQSSQMEPTLPMSLFWTSTFQNCDRISSYCFKPPSLWYFVRVALGNWYTDSGQTWITIISTECSTLPCKFALPLFHKITLHLLASHLKPHSRLYHAVLLFRTKEAIRYEFFHHLSARALLHCHLFPYYYTFSIFLLKDGITFSFKDHPISTCTLIFILSYILKHFHTLFYNSFLRIRKKEKEITSHSTFPFNYSSISSLILK